MWQEDNGLWVSEESDPHGNDSKYKVVSESSYVYSVSEELYK